MRRHRIHVSRRGGTSETVAREVGGRLRERRKEVALGRLRFLTILLILGAWGVAATDGAPPDSAAAPPTQAARPPAPVPPVKYLEAGASLFNSGQYGLASKYIKAAQMYRDQLTESEQTVLDAYLKEIAKVPAGACRSRASVAPAASAASPTAAPRRPRLRRAGRRVGPGRAAPASRPRPHRSGGVGPGRDRATVGTRPPPRHGRPRPRRPGRPGRDRATSRPRPRTRPTGGGTRPDRGDEPGGVHPEPGRPTGRQRRPRPGLGPEANGPLAPPGGPRADPPRQLRRRRGEGRAGPQDEPPLGTVRRHPGQGGRVLDEGPAPSRSGRRVRQPDPRPSPGEGQAQGRPRRARSRRVRDGRGDRPRRQDLGPELRPLRRQPRQGRPGRQGAAPPRQAPERPAPGAGQPGRL